MTKHTIDSVTGRRLTDPVEITDEMIDAGALAVWGEKFPPAIARDIAARIYRAMELKRRETERAE
jgi:hypothetical protein